MTLTGLFCGNEGLRYGTGSISIKVTRAFRINQIHEMVEHAVKRFFRVVMALTGTDNKRAAINRLRHTPDVPKRYLSELIDELFGYIDMLCSTVLSVMTYKPRPAAHIAAVCSGPDVLVCHSTLQQCLPYSHSLYRHQSRGSEEPDSENDSYYSE